MWADFRLNKFAKVPQTKRGLSKVHQFKVLRSGSYPGWSQNSQFCPAHGKLMMQTRKFVAMGLAECKPIATTSPVAGLVLILCAGEILRGWSLCITAPFEHHRPPLARKRSGWSVRKRFGEWSVGN